MVLNNKASREQEARTELLRKKARSCTSENLSEETAEKQKSDFSVSDHLNFFKDIEDAGGYVGGTNEEHEKEEKARKEKFEKDIGLLTYLGQSSLEAKGEAPWHLKSSTKALISDPEGKDEVASAKQKSRLDPLNDMQKYLALKEKKSGETGFTKSNEERNSRQHKHNIEKKAAENKKLSKIEELRAKRLKREAEERKRSQQFLESYRKGPSSDESSVVLDDRLRQYNSQFNPHLARNNLVPEK
ncbi:leukocyte receptor cluster member 1 homolog [Stegodyphus dumicola]|uniref:leukocyte receptor cluster member 1 homolog n=1 Tax=Stegodyphus dumicola TaxID=202533 RepID=UPI0015A99C1D|nr:leukocyte receptor cluster member 1 homolog [Stegodyphus dumicola]